MVLISLLTKTSRFNQYVCTFVTASVKGLKNTTGRVLYWLLARTHQKKCVTQHIFSIVASLLLSSFKVQFQGITTLLGRISAWKLRRQLKNVVLLVTKNIMKLSYPIVPKHFPSPQNYVQRNCPSVVPMLFKSIGITF